MLGAIYGDIAGSVAEEYYGMTAEQKAIALAYLSEDLQKVALRFQKI